MSLDQSSKTIVVLAVFKFHYRDKIAKLLASPNDPSFPNKWELATQIGRHWEKGCFSTPFHP
jgi:hypothetical protein